MRKTPLESIAAWFSLVALLSVPVFAQQVWPPDPRGRHIIPHGVVVLTSDPQSDYDYTPRDYQRMVQLGVNLQVIRLMAGAMGAWPGYTLEKKYLDKLDRLVDLGKKAGVVSSFKMTIYDIKGVSSGRGFMSFGPQDWTDFWLNKDGRQDVFLAAWRKLFEHYRNEPYVVGYDLLNESSKGLLKIDDAAFVADYLIPFHRKAADLLHEVDPKGWALFQPPIGAPAMAANIGRTGVVYAPHMYPDVMAYFKSGGTPDPSKYAPELDRFEREAAAFQSPLLIGEFGNPAFLAADSDLDKQALVTKGARAAVSEFDRRALGSVQPWFTGCRNPLDFGTGKFHWGLFQGDSAAGGAERKYMVDILGRPFPLVTAGRVKTFGFDFASRRFHMEFTAAPAKGESEIFVPRTRHFPDGFRLIHSNGLVLAYDGAAPSGLRVEANPGKVDATAWHWDEARSRIVVRRWSAAGPATIRIVPGLRD